MYSIRKMFKVNLIIILISNILFNFGLPCAEAVAQDNSGGPAQVQGQQGAQPVFKPGNAVRINVYPDTSSFLNNVYPIDGYGNVMLPVVGKKNISSMNKDEFKGYLKNAYAQYLKFPNIIVQPLVRVSLLGGFARPGMYYLDPDYSLWNAVYLAGGTLREDGLKKMKWERNRETVTDNLIPILQSGRSLEEIGFRSGDQIWTPSPDKVSTLRRISSELLPFVTLGVSVYTLYYFTKTGRRAY